ncbi:MFS transporter [Paraburkholderia sp.]|uniref:MFS transporter n=1 Tax=Paraburkholderia sp. TaxID=1926495 RepID=UPI0023939FBF|nr:MFS transporter [Paraburkholderia sp.]MDE1181905.1 MFS transporter [Paraburkholderia sp.]
MAAFSSWIGSALEYYDFFIYAMAAALVFGKVFFPAGDPKLSTVAAFATFGVGYVARPLGAFFMGHIGDKFGRKRILTSTLLLMGLSTFLIGLLPTYSQIGIASPILLVCLRLLQGLSASGEQAGATSLALEHAPDNRRGFVSSFSLSGTSMGFVLATLAFLPLSALPDQALLSWGWRIPFLLSAVVISAGLWVRRRLPETPVFEAEVSRHASPDAPVAELFRTQTPDVFRVVFGALYSVVSSIFSVFLLSYAVNDMHIPRTRMLLLFVAMNVVSLAVVPLWGMVSDRIGRRPVFAVGTLGSAAFLWPTFWAISHGDVLLACVFGFVVMSVFYSASNAVWPSFSGEMFATRVRLSGVAIGSQIGITLGGFAPTLGAALLKSGPNGWVPVAELVSAAAIVATLAALTARETHNVPLDQLGSACAARTRSCPT